MPKKGWFEVLENYKGFVIIKGEDWRYGYWKRYGEQIVVCKILDWDKSFVKKIIDDIKRRVEENIKN